MELFSTETISQIINLPIIPVLLLPVTGLALLVFYNRIAAINQRLRFLQKELRDFEFSERKGHRHSEMIATLKAEVQILHARARKIAVGITSLLISIALFCLCALFAVLSMFYPGLLQIALIFWFCGPLLICNGVIFSLLELRQSFHAASMQTELVEKWGEGTTPGD